MSAISSQSKQSGDEFVEEPCSIYSFVVVFQDRRILSFRSGKFVASSDPILGNRSIGVGGAVFDDESDLLFESMFGIAANGIRELCYGIGLPRRLAERARYNNELRPVVAIKTKNHGTEVPVIHCVLAYECPIEFVPTKSALSVNDIKWIDGINPGNSLDDYDYTSQMLFSSGYVRDIIRSGAAA